MHVALCISLLTASVAGLLLTEPNVPPVSTERRREALRQVTGSGAEFTRDVPTLEQERELRGKEAKERKQEHWEWITVAEHVLGLNADN